MTPAEFARLRKVCARHAVAWGKACGLGPASRTLHQLLMKSCHAEPWAWTEAKGMDRMAEEFDVSRRTLFRHLAELEEAGILAREQRVSNAMRRSDTAFPIYRVHPKVPYEIEYWSSNSGSESAILALGECHFGTRHTSHNNPATPSAARDSSPSDPLVRDTEEKEKGNNKGRLRRRHLKLVPPVEAEDVVTPPRFEVGKLPETTDTPSKEKKPGRVPSSRLAFHFEEEWVRHVRSIPGKMFPAQPWNLEGKTRFYKWVTTTLLPTCGDEDTAREVITLFCTDVAAGRIALPPHGVAPVFTRLGQSLDQLLRRLKQTEAAMGGRTKEDLDADLERRREENRQAARRRA